MRNAPCSLNGWADTQGEHYLKIGVGYVDVQWSFLMTLSHKGWNFENY